MYQLRTIPAVAMLALVSLAAAKNPAKIKLCMDFGGNGNCQELEIIGLAFDEFNGPAFFPELCTQTNGVTECPSSAQLLAGSDVHCYLGNDDSSSMCVNGGDFDLEIVADGQ
jgi:hypothetical protein